MPKPPGTRDLTLRRRLKIIAFLEAMQRDSGDLPKGAMNAAVTKFGHHRNTIRRVWTTRDDKDEKDVSATSRTRRFTDDEMIELVAAVPIHERTTIRSTAAGAGIPHSTIQNYFGSEKPLRRATGRLKPALTEKHKLDRLRFVLSFVDRPIGLRSLHFDSMYDTVHIDEKWFNLYKVATSYVLTPGEKPPHIPCANKRFITKVMFLAAVARPRYDYSKGRGFDGKLGIFPIVKKRLAKRTTKNQRAGDLITEPLSVDKAVYHDLLVNSVLPAIRAKWPGRKGATIYIQQDNASPHVCAEAAVQMAGMDQYGWDVQIRRQPAKSPDLNILDLGYFNAIQSLQHRKRAYNVDTLIKAVEESYAEMKIKSLEKCFLTLQAVMEQIMLAEGGIDYDLPRVKKKHFPHGIFPSALVCSENAHKIATEVLKLQDK